MTERLVFVRHGRIGWGQARRLIGSSDPPLDARGNSQAKALAKRLEHWDPDQCFCSPLARCRQTAASAAAGLSVRVDDRLREIDFGRWENRAFEEISREEPALVDRWGMFAEDFAFPGGESLEGFQARVQGALAEMVRQPCATVVAITHGGVIRSALCQLLGLAPDKYLAFEIGYAAVVVLHVFDEGCVLAALEQAEGFTDG